MLWYTPGIWNGIVSLSFALSCVRVPFYDEIRSIFHVYNTKGLQHNFFYMGKDVRFAELTEQLANTRAGSEDNDSSRYLPFLIPTVTSSDYQARETWTPSAS